MKEKIVDIKSINRKFLEDLRTSILRTIRLYEKPLEEDSKKLNWGTRRDIKRLVELDACICDFLDIVGDCYAAGYGNYDLIHVSKYSVWQAKKIKKELKNVIRKNKRNFLRLNFQDFLWLLFSYSYDYSGSIISEYNLKYSHGTHLDLKQFLKDMIDICDELIIVYKKELKKQKKSSNIDNKEVSNIKNVTNEKSIELSKKAKMNSNELLDLTLSMINLSEEMVKSLFSPFDSSEKIDFDQDKLVEYEKKYIQFSKKYERLNYAEKNEQIKELKSCISEQELTSIFKVSNLSINNLFIGQLSPESLIKLINSKVKEEMFNKGYYYYGKTKDVIIDKPLDREIEICCVTHYMDLEEIHQAYIGLKNEIANLEFNKSYYEGLQQNFALAIYRKLINMGYIKDDQNLKDAILFEICTKILKESECKFINSSINEEIDIIQIINSKKYNIVKKAFEKESSFGRLKKDMQTKKKEKGNARKL